MIIEIAIAALTLASVIGMGNGAAFAKDKSDAVGFLPAIP